MLYSIESSSQWLYPDSPVTQRRELPALVAAAGGSASFQVLLNGLVPGDTLTATWDCGAFPAQAFRELPVQVTHNTGIKGFTVEDIPADWETAKAYATRPAPFWVYDALEPVGKAGVPVSAATEALYLSVSAPLSARPGTYPVSLRLQAGEQSAVLQGQLEITRAAIPEETLAITNWFSVGKMAAAHGLAPYSQPHWDMVRRYGELMRRARQNVFWVTWDNLVIGRDAAGDYTFDFSRIQRLIEMYLSMGFTQIEGAPIYSRENWDATVFFIPGPEGRIPALSPEGYALSAALLTAWGAFLQENGWYDLLTQHVGDEPHEGCADEYRILSGIVRKFLPGVPLIDAVEMHGLNGAVDIWVPKDDFYERNQSAFEAHRAKGDELWFYTCCIPGGFYANRLLDMPLIRSRMLHWGNYRYNLTGFLHWGLNQWRPDQDPYAETCPEHGAPNHRLPAGDTHVVYPSKDGKEVYGSMRLEAMRGGAEEYELLCQLAAVDKEKADTLVSMCFKAFNACDCPAETFEEVRAQLLRSF